MARADAALAAARVALDDEAAETDGLTPRSTSSSLEYDAEQALLLETCAEWIGTQRFGFAHQ